MKKGLCKWILRVAGWKLGPVDDGSILKCVICVAPHTSNWDFIVGKLFYGALGRDAGFLIKKEWFFFPFNLLFRWMGGVPVDRKHRTSVVEQMAVEFDKRKVFHLAVTPEGTRKRAKEWKKGFYYIALRAHVPVMTAYLDYGKKEVGIKGVFYPTGNADEDMKAIRACYEGVTAKYPENFVSLNKEVSAPAGRGETELGS